MDNFPLKSKRSLYSRCNIRVLSKVAINARKMKRKSKILVDVLSISESVEFFVCAAVKYANIRYLTKYTRAQTRIRVVLDLLV